MQQQFPATLKAHHAWERWMPLWYGIFYFVLIVTTILALVGGSHALGAILAILGLTLLLATWYGLCIIIHDHYWQQHPLIAMGYLAIGWML